MQTRMALMFCLEIACLTACGNSDDPAVTAECGPSKACPAGFTCSADGRCLATPKLTVKAATDQSGATATVTAGSCSGPTCEVESGQTVTFTASAAPAGTRFSGWTGDPACTGTSPVLSVVITAATSCKAVYVRRFQVTGRIQDGLSGAVAASSPDATATCAGATCTVDSGGAVTLLAPTLAGYRVTGWTGAGCDQGVVAGQGITLRPSSGDLTCTAAYVLGVSVSGTVVGATGAVTASSPSGGRCSAGSCTIDAGGEVVLTAPTIDGTRFLGWSGDPGCAGTSPMLDLKDVRTTTSCVAGYVARYTVSVSQAANGTATAAADAASCAGKLCTCSGGTTCTVDQGATVNVVATPATGYHFTSWSGTGCAGTTATLPLTNTSAACVPAFAPDTFKVTGAVSPAGAGTVAVTCPGGSCDQVPYGASVTFTATPASGHAFAHWDCNGGDTHDATTVTVTAPLTCTASFNVRVVGTVDSTRDTIAGSVAAVDGSCTSPSGQSATCTVVPGRTVTFTVTAATNQPIHRWTGACSAGATTTVSFAAGAPGTCAAESFGLWSRTYGRAPPAGAVVPTDDTLNAALALGGGGGTLLLGTNGGINAQGASERDAVWLQTIDERDGTRGALAFLDYSGGGTTLSSAAGLVRTSRGYLFLGTTLLGAQAPFVVAFDANLAPTGGASWPQRAVTQTARWLLRTGDGGVRAAVTAVTTDGSTWTRLLSLGEDGALASSVGLHDKDPACATARATGAGPLVDAGDGGAFVVLSPNPATTDLVVLRLDAGGAPRWERRIEAGKSLIAVAGAAPVRDAGGKVTGVLLSGVVAEATAGFDGFVAWLDADGNPGFADGAAGKIIGRTTTNRETLKSEVFASVLATPDGNLIAAGYANPTTSGFDAYAALLAGKDGTVIGDMTYGGSGTDVVVATSVPAGGGYLLAGTTASSGGAPSDLWALRVGDDLAIGFDARSGLAAGRLGSAITGTLRASAVEPKACLDLVAEQQATADAPPFAQPALLVDERVQAP
jgi:hypothetical protein